ncbi:hypothetical protein PoB_005118700 [Plakobranchus ocellatus]|uniref:Uncharacterized protein n=1 Tax=Plakobranchus ocellatus TaxID=259542 RepID=A0AAV4BZY7_9GAST|nr:hypothetical protein PoB_005118700 [Plakobranchus ocellatus]
MAASTIAVAHLAPAHGLADMNISTLPLGHVMNSTTFLQGYNQSNQSQIQSIINNGSITRNNSSLPSLPLAEASSERTPSNVNKRFINHSGDSSIIVKISLLLVVTAFVLVASYKFVVHLFVGYSDRKDDVFTDGFSDDEDSTGMKKSHGPILDIG